MKGLFCLFVKFMFLQFVGIWFVKGLKKILLVLKSHVMELLTSDVNNKKYCDELPVVLSATATLHPQSNSIAL